MRPLVGLLFALAVLGCGGEAPPAKAPVGRTPASGEPAERVLPGPPGLSASLVAQSSTGDVPVAYAHRAGQGVVCFIQAGKIYSRTLSPEAKLGAPLELGAAVSPTAFSLKPREGGFALFFGQRIDQNHLFYVVLLDNAGKPVGARLEMAPVPDSTLSFADFVPQGEGGTLVYETQKLGRANVFVAEVSKTGPKGPPKPVFVGASGWAAAESGGGLAFGLVRSDNTPSSGKPTLGRVSLIMVAPDSTVGAETVIDSSPTAEPDVELGSLEGGLLLAWTDVRDETGAVRLAATDRSGKLLGPPLLAAPPIGEQALIGLVASPKQKRALLAWENLGQMTSGSRVLELATVGLDLQLDKARTRLLLDAEERPDMVADDDGFAVLTLAPARLSEAAALENDPSWPTLVRLASDLTPRSGEPLRFAAARAREGVPDAAYGLSCNGGTCFALAADLAMPSSLYVVSAPKRTGPWALPAWRTADESKPKVAALGNMVEGPRLSAARSTALGEGGLLAYVTYHAAGDVSTEPAPRGEAPYAATLGVRAIKADGSPGAEAIISKRALSTGGVSLVSSPFSKKPEAVIAWVASDKGTPQVFATKVDETGQKLAQKKITVVRREGKKDKGLPDAEDYAFDVSIAASPAASKGENKGSDGYVVAWVDTRDKNGEVYAARINKDLEKVSVDRRITQSPGEASEVSLLVVDGDAFVAFADTRDGGAADIYFSHLDAQTLRVIDDDSRVYASAGPSRSPRLFLRGGQLMLAWIEDPAPNPEAGRAPDKASTLRIAEIGPSGRLVHAPRVLAAPEGASIKGFSIGCSGSTWDSCRSVLTFSLPQGHPTLGAFGFTRDGSPEAIVRLGSLTSGPFADASFSSLGPNLETVFFIEENAGRGRARRLELRW